IGEAKTNSLSGTTDSAAAGTALSSGYKTVNAYVGKDGNLKDVSSLTELAAEKGKATAVMSTEAQTGATPSAFSAHANSRHDTDVILASQAALVEKYGTIINCDYNVYTEAEMVALRAAIRDTLNQLSQDEDGFFMMYEEAYIDKHSHNNRAAEAYLAMVRFNQAIALFMEYAFYNPNTVVIITADHETGGLQIAANGNFYYTSGSHTSANVPVFAYGAGCEVFDGQTIENVQIPKTIAAMFGVEIEGTNPVQYPALVSVK
ncbi:MAG: alkaline phosphatase, partial [Clostridia bacterium]|nr:alkaline phosphatase [Clostridia bacterium]